MLLSRYAVKGFMLTCLNRALCAGTLSYEIPVYPHNLHTCTGSKQLYKHDHEKKGVEEARIHMINTREVNFVGNTALMPLPKLPNQVTE